MNLQAESGRDVEDRVWKIASWDEEMWTSCFVNTSRVCIDIYHLLERIYGRQQSLQTTNTAHILPVHSWHSFS